MVGRFHGMLYLSAKHSRSLFSDEKTPYERPFGIPFNGQVIPFGAMVEYHPISAKDQSRIHQFGKKVLPGLILGYAVYAERIWKGDTLVADVVELETMDASEIYSKRLNAHEVICPKENGKFIFPVADGRIKPLGGDQDLRTSTSKRHRPIRGEGQRDSLGESEGSLPPPPQDSYPDAGDAINDFWSMPGNFMYRHHVEPRVKLYSPREGSFPVPLKYFVSSTTHTNLDVLQESLIDDYWNIDGSRDLSDSWQATSRPDHLCPELWTKLARNAKLREKHKWAIEKNQSSIMLEDYEESISLTLRTRSSKKPSGMLENIGKTNRSRHALQDMQEKQEWRDP